MRIECALQRQAPIRQEQALTWTFGGTGKGHSYVQSTVEMTAAASEAPERECHSGYLTPTSSARAPRDPSNGRMKKIWAAQLATRFTILWNSVCSTSTMPDIGTAFGVDHKVAPLNGRQARPAEPPKDEYLF